MNPSCTNRFYFKEGGFAQYMVVKGDRELEIYYTHDLSMIQECFLQAVPVHEIWPEGTISRWWMPSRDKAQGCSYQTSDGYYVVLAR